jgi:hypothetical protein
MWLKAAVVDLRRQLSEQHREIVLLKQESEAVREMQNQIEGIMIRLTQSEELFQHVVSNVAALRDASPRIQNDIAILKEVLSPTPVPKPPAPPTQAKQFPPTMIKGGKYDVPDGIIAHLARQCGGSVHKRKAVEVTSSRPYNQSCSAKNIADLESDSRFHSAYRKKEEDIPHTSNNWVCYDFKERRIVPTHYAIRTNVSGPAGIHLKSWRVETSIDGDEWRQIDHKENNELLKGSMLTETFPVTWPGKSRFIRLVNIGRNHNGDDCLCICAWEIFGTLIE